ncbi:MAG: carbohydrate-binding domain-containing protein, partial [Clostridia bacterium]|nr:carbohydrate-binding domain-containing protein [Clostridia bacterium]
GEFDIDCDGDGFQADASLTINGGTFDVQTWKGSGVWNDTLADANSCKGLKAAGDRAEEAGIEPTLTITGGSFTLNTGDDALHSDAYATVTGGAFTINTGDDGMHADTSLILGSENGLARDPDVRIESSYEGLEGGTVYIYSGRYYVVASDDGVNAAGGSGNGTDPGFGGGGGWNPGGGHGPGGNTPGGSSSSSDYNIYIYGGELYVNCDGDGLDSNGGLYLYGGTQAVFSMRSGGDNSALDADGTILVQGATLITAGSTGADGTAQSSWFGADQKYTASRTSVSAGKAVNASANGSVLMSYTLTKNVSYVLASWPSSVSSSAPTITTANSAAACKGGSWSHSWDDGAVTAATAESSGLTTYTCSVCGATETQTIPALVTVPECDHAFEGGEATDEGFTVTFAGDEGVSSITVYETQDYSGASVSVAADGATVSRSSATGEPDSSGDGQVNFTIVLSDGYALSGVTVTAGTYKNIKGPADTGLANTYRITKITADTTVTITTVQCEHGAVADGTAPLWSWSSKYNSATFSYVCAECGGTVNIDGAVTSELTGTAEITFTATASVGETVYTDTQTAAPFTATFVGEHASVNVYYTQDYSATDEEDAATAVARDSDSGRPVVSGDGQINLTVVVEDGYELESVTVTGGYKNLKDVSADAGVANTYRITKITGDLTVTITVKASAPEIMPGDMDGDNEITVGDALAALRIAARLVEETDKAIAVGDVDGDGSITVSDALRILRFAAGLMNSFR